MKQDSISTSEFMEQQVVETSSVFTDFSTIAARGYNVISRARRNGRWWVLKSLEEKVRNTEPFVSMLRKEFDIYCCPVNLQTAQESFPKPFRIGLRAFFFKKQAP